VALSTLPRIAAANGAATLLTAWITAEPTPARSAASAPSAAADAVASATPIPRPTTGVHSDRKPVPLVTLVVAPIPSPAAIRANPSATMSLAPARAATRSANPAPTARPPISGSSRRPLPMALVPRMAWSTAVR
jgi:hypothetical protein